MSSIPQRTVSAVIEVRDGAGHVRRVAIEAERLVIGRAADADLTLASDAVSRRHAEMIRDKGGQWRIRDLDSHNGTFVAGQAVKDAPVSPGQVIRIAQFELTLIVGTTVVGQLQHEQTVDDTGTMTVNTLQQMGSPRVDSRQLFALQRLARQLIDEADAMRRLAMLCELMVSEAMRGWHATAVRIDADGGPMLLLSTVSSNVANFRGRELHLSRSTLDAVRRAHEPVLATHAGGADAIELSIAAESEPMAVMACPLRREGEAVDVLYVVLPAACGTGEWLAMGALAVEAWTHAEAAWDARRKAEDAARIEQDLQRARQLQLGLLPQRLAVSPALDIALHFEPCLAVGGDYVDVLQLPDGRVLLAVADVCGKGIQAAMIAASVRTFVHAAASHFEAVAMVDGLGSYLLSSLPDWSFVTMLVVVIDPAAGTLEVVNAGHPPPLQLTDAGELVQVHCARRLPLGIDVASPTPTQASTHPFAPGDLLALYTDGLTEVVTDTGQWLGVEGLANHLRRARHATSDPAATVATSLCDQLATVQQGRPAEDDQTLLLVRRL